MRLRRLILPCFLLFILSAKAAEVDTISIYSNAMHKDLKCVVIKPASYNKKPARRGGIESFPVVYLLHGYDGWYSNWLIRVPQLNDYADQYNMMIVCPEGLLSKENSEGSSRILSK